MLAAAPPSTFEASSDITPEWLVYAPDASPISPHERIIRDLSNVERCGRERGRGRRAARAGERARGKRAGAQAVGGACGGVVREGERRAHCSTASVCMQLLQARALG